MLLLLPVSGGLAPFEHGIGLLEHLLGVALVLPPCLAGASRSVARLEAFLRLLIVLPVGNPLTVKMSTTGRGSSCVGLAAVIVWGEIPSSRTDSWTVCLVLAWAWHCQAILMIKLLISMYVAGLIVICGARGISVCRPSGGLGVMVECIALWIITD